eukprot:CAMPEP_0117689116 /NCGR_PEP_ID=MMETSP0804-20121206/24278_1 /TAXON_ID=1074897 /ORGANISM="Tetraselmis astigmatica, Strain CCMP880" /LENGTH=167 /DNA_ID=CAMNT_0005501787 /DNA_START=313 /DNA_END=816 /DNA_ORIENTATION=+
MKPETRNDLDSLGILEMAGRLASETAAGAAAAAGVTGSESCIAVRTIVCGTIYVQGGAAHLTAAVRHEEPRLSLTDVGQRHVRVLQHSISLMEEVSNDNSASASIVPDVLRSLFGWTVAKVGRASANDIRDRPPVGNSDIPSPVAAPGRPKHCEAADSHCLVVLHGF